jgi:hypothetical protein
MPNVLEGIVEGREREEEDLWPAVEEGGSSQHLRDEGNGVDQSGRTRECWMHSVCVLCGGEEGEEGSEIAGGATTNNNTHTSKTKRWGAAVQRSRRSFL